MRLPWPAVVGGIAVALVGAAGLVRGSTPETAVSTAHAHGTGVFPRISISGVYVRAPVPPTKVAAAYFTIYNTTSKADRLTGVISGASARAVLHVVNKDGSMSASPGGEVIPAHGSLVLTTGRAHVMLEQLFGTVKAGQTVNLELDFRTAASIYVVAPVIAPGAPAPPADPKPSGVK